MPRKVGSKAYRDQQRERLVKLGLGGRQLIEYLVADLMRCEYRPREAWRLAYELTQGEVAARFNQIRDDPNSRMRGSRICEYEKWPRGGVRPPVRTLKILAAIYETTWDRLVDVDDLEEMPASDRQAFLDVSDLRYGDLLNLPVPWQGRPRNPPRSAGELATVREQLRIPSPRPLLGRSGDILPDEPMRLTGREEPLVGLRVQAGEHLLRVTVMATPLSVTWVAAIHASADDFIPLGAAVVIDDRRVLTSAHVVTVAGTVRPQLWVAFPASDDSFVSRRHARQVRLAAHPMADLAVVELEEPLPAGVAVAPLRCPRPADVVNRTWWAFGFTRDDPRGNQADGRIGASLGYGWVRLDTNARYDVEPGFSGGGLWCPDYAAVIGVIGRFDDRGDGRAILLHQADQYLPTEKIRLLTQWTAATADEVAQAAWGWTLTQDEEADRHWRPRARGVSVASERGHRFRGRRLALAEIVAWLDRPAPDRKVLVVTGSPGAGKSAVLGRIVTTADAEMRARFPPDGDAPKASVGSVACAVHAKDKTALDVATEIARAASARLPERVDDLSVGLREVLAKRRARRFNIVIDALDEASDLEQARTIITGIVLAIAETCADVGAQVVVSTRRSDDAGDLLRIFGPARITIDLDDPRYFAVEDLVAFAQATLQLLGDERPGNPYQPDDVAAPVARRIAELADRNFLIAGLIARTHGLYDDTAISPATLSFIPSLASTLATFVDRLAPIERVTARELLTVLAFAEAPGLPLQLWQLGVQALAGAHVTPEQLIRFAHGSAANFLVESAGESTTVVFRIFHQALSDALTDERARVVPPAADEAALTKAFTGYGARIAWDCAPTYLFRSLPGHAMRAGLVDELLTDTGYVLRADLCRLIPAAASARTPEGLQQADLLRLTPRAIPAQPPERLALLSVTETLDRLGTAFRQHQEDAPYRGLWATGPRRVERAVLDGHTDEVKAVCVVRVEGCDLLASTSDDRTVRIWDPATGAPERILKGHTGGVNAVCTVRVQDGALLASASNDHTVRIWDPVTGAAKRILRGHSGEVRDVCVVRAGNREMVASAGADATIRIWDPTTGSPERTLRGHGSWVNEVCAIRVHDRELLASASDDHTVRIWDPATGATKRTLHGHTGEVMQVCTVQVEGRELLASTDGDATAILWDPAGRPERTLHGPSGWAARVCAIRIQDRELLISIGADATVRIWDPATGRPERTLHERTGRVNGLCAVRVQDRELLVSAGADATVRIWDPASGIPERALGGRIGEMTHVCTVLVDGRELIASAGADATVRIWDPATGRPERTLHERTGRVNGLCAVRVQDRELLVSAGADATMRIWDPATGRPERTIKGCTGGIRGVSAVRLDGRELLASVSGHCTVRIWDPVTGAPERTLDGRTGLVNAVCAMRADNCDLIVSAGADATVRIWDPVTGTTKRILGGHIGGVNGVCAVRVQDRELLASASDDHTVRIWDPGTGYALHVIPIHYNALALASFNDHCLIVGTSVGLLALTIT